MERYGWGVHRKVSWRGYEHDGQHRRREILPRSCILPWKPGPPSGCHPNLDRAPTECTGAGKAQSQRGAGRRGPLIGAVTVPPGPNERRSGAASTPTPLAKAL